MNNKENNFESKIKSDINSHINCCKNILSGNVVNIASAAVKIIQSLKLGGAIFWCGNGGSASDSQHLNAELIGRFEKDRPPLKSVALTTDTSVITALSNDYSYDLIFKRQLEALGKKGDVLVSISTSGESKNIINVLKEAKRKKITTISFLGKKGGKAKKYSNIAIIVPSDSTARIQEMHIMIGQMICSLVEKNIFK
jgi:D-sedoheptulose 7-phosphate isomerase